MRVMQTELAGLSSDHAHVLALRSDHFIYRDQPALVVRAVRAVVRAVRDEAPSRHASRCSPVRASAASADMDGGLSSWQHERPAPAGLLLVEGAAGWPGVRDARSG